MIDFCLLFFAVYLISLVIPFLFGYFRQIFHEQLLSNDAAVELSELTIIVPVRNEQERIYSLIHSIKNSEKLPSKIIFVDDHSEDETVHIIDSELSEYPIKILHLPSDLSGKKMAIRHAIPFVSSKWILSLDADVWFEKKYFEALEKLPSADLYVLPAVLTAKVWWQHLFEVDILLVNAINLAVSGWKRPIIASGANMLYTKEAFLKFDQIASHQHISSGDDIYLLRDFRRNEANVRLFSRYSLAVFTETPQGFKEFMHQRLRWVAKTGDVGDKLSNFVIVLQGILSLTFFSVIVVLALNAEVVLLIFMIALKITTDSLIFLLYFNRMRRMKAWLIMPLYELIYPLFFIVLVLLSFKFNPIWKGREIRSK
jgi:biofilm PGA synthesis N-glycosyltransferase PgaC